MNQKRAVPGKIPCPTCRELTTLPANGVAGLRNDFKVQKIEDLLKSMNIQSRSSPAVCSLCEAQKKTVQVKINYISSNRLDI